MGAKWEFHFFETDGEFLNVATRFTLSIFLMSKTACSRHGRGVWSTCYRTGYYGRSGLKHFFPGLRTTPLRIVPPCQQLVSWIPGAVIFQVCVFLSVHKRTSRTMGKSRGTFCRGIAIFWERSGSLISSKQMMNFLMWPPVLLCQFSFMSMTACSRHRGGVWSTCYCIDYY